VAAQAQAAGQASLATPEMEAMAGLMAEQAAGAEQGSIALAILVLVAMEQTAL